MPARVDRHPLELLRLSAFALAAVLVLGGCRHDTPEPYRLPTGARLDPVGTSIPLGSMPVTMTFSPDARHIVAVLSGYREQGIQVIDAETRQVTQTLVQPSAFLGAAFAPDGHTLFVSGGNRDCVYVYAWGDSAALRDSIALGPPPDSLAGGRVYPALLACSPDGSQLYIAGNLDDKLYAVDAHTHRVIQKLPTDRYPYGVVVAPDGRVYVSNWGASTVATFTPRGGRLVAGPRISVGRHPSAMALRAGGTRLYVACAASDRIAVVDTKRDSVIATLNDAAPGGPDEGSTPNGLALSPDGRRLYVAEADNNAVAVFPLGENGDAATLTGRIPSHWYPTAVLARDTTLWVLTGKGVGTAANPTMTQPGRRHGRPDPPFQYSLAQTRGTLDVLGAPADAALPELSRRVAAANGWDRAPETPTLPPFKHVVYIIRENRTYDQVLGDLASADGDTSLVLFPRRVTPNGHALAERFGIFDRFHTSGEVSGDGHNWTTAGYASDYLEKTLPSVYSDRGRGYDYDGTNRGELTNDDVNEGSRGHLWDAALRAGVTLRNYGEMTHADEKGRWVANKPSLAPHTDPEYPGFDMGIPDTVRTTRWLASFAQQVAGDSMPALSILYLPFDHTAGGRKGSPTPQAYVANNDRALGLVVEALSRSKYWRETAVFVVEDDAQDGPDHVDSHRSPLLVISAYGHPGVRHRFANTVDVLTTIDRILGLGAMSKFDHYGRVLTECFGDKLDLTPYRALASDITLQELNPDPALAAIMSRSLDLSAPDRADAALMNRVLWLAIKGPERPYPKRHPAGG